MNDAATGTPVFLRVEFSLVESVRRVVFLELAGLPARQRSVLAVAITRRLRDEHALRSGVEECYEAGELGALWGRSREWVVRTFFAAGTMPWGRIHRDGGGWLIPASVAEAYLAAHVPTEKVAAEKSAAHGCNRGGKDLQSRAGLESAAGRANGRFGRLDADRIEAVTVGTGGLAGVSGG